MPRLSLYEQVERRLIPVLSEMENAGIRVDEAELRRMSADFGVRMAAMEIDAHKLAAGSFGLGSPKQLGEVLFDELKLPGGKRTPSGTWGTDANALQGAGRCRATICPRKVLEWRQLAKLKSTYADALVEEINPATGRVHTSYAMAATSTGRISSNDPNLQNIPIRTEEGARIRRVFVAEPGHVLVSADYSQIELRLLAHVADIAPLREAFRHRPGHPCAHRERGVRHPAGADGWRHAPAREGDQFRHHLRHQRVSAWHASSASRRARPRAISTPISCAIPAFAITWNARRRRRASTAMC